MRLTWAAMILLGLLNAPNLQAQNLLTENTSFEVGRWGFDAMPYEFIRTWTHDTYPTVTDETAYDGKYSLKLANPSGMGGVQLHFPVFTLPEKTHVVISFYAKSDVEGTNLVPNIWCGFKSVFRKPMALTKQWKRYVFEGDLGADPSSETTNSGLPRHYALVMLATSLKGNPKFQNIWIDAVQIEKNVLTDYQPAPSKSLEAAIDLAQFPTRQFLIYPTGTQEEANLRIYSKDGAGKSFSVEYQIKDELTNDILFTQQSKGTLDASGHALDVLKLPTIERRLYRILATVRLDQQQALAQRMYGGIVDLTNMPRASKFFGASEVGLCLPCDPMNHFVVRHDSHHLGSWRMDPALHVRLAKSVGVSWVHLYEELSIQANEPEKGQFDWTDTDHYVSLLRQNDLEIMSLLTCQGISPGGSPHFPRWILTGGSSEGGTWSANKGMPLVDVEEYGKFCYLAAQRYAGVIDMWESWNEPGVQMPEKNYMAYLKTCDANIRQANPNAKILGLTGTWDVGGDLYGWVKSCLKLGAAQYFDMIAIHGYHAVDRHYGAKVMQTAQEITGKNIPVWNTETGEEIFSPYGELRHFKTIVTKTTSYDAAQGLRCFIKHALNNLASGVERLSWFNFADSGTWLGKQGCTMIQFDGSPDAALLGYNFMAQQFDRAKFVQEVQPDKRTVCYIFDHPDGPILAYWDSAKNLQATLPLPTPGNIKLLDCLGGALPISYDAKNKTVTVPLNDMPHFIVARGLTAAQLVTAAKNLHAAGDGAVYVIQSKLGETQEGLPAICLSVENRTSKVQSPSIRAESKPAWMNRVVVPDPLELPPQLVSHVFLPFEAGKESITDGQMKLTFQSGQQKTQIQIPMKIMRSMYVDKSPLIDGDSSDAQWGKIKPTQVDGWTSVSSLWNEHGLYFLVSVTDDQVVSYQDVTPHRMMFQGDVVEMFFDWNRQSDLDIARFTRHVTQLAFSAPSDQTPYSISGIGARAPSSFVEDSDAMKPGEEYSGNRDFPLDKVTHKSRKTATGYDMEIFIPWSCAQALGQQQHSVIGYSFSIKDVDDKYNQRKRVIWAGDDKNFQNTTPWGLLILTR